ncbi:MAG: DNA methyltransferase [Nanoarchaeota archaeon]|nr:DNA methyltransferase [Nanoarchaeota archaeon]
MYLLVLSRENLELARAEALALCDSKEAQVNKEFLFLDSSQSEANLLSKRLALTQSIDRVLFSCSLKDLKKEMERFTWIRVIRGSYAVRVHGKVTFTEKELGGMIFRKLKTPKVDLSSPDCRITVFSLGKQAHVCLRIHEQAEDFQARRPHLRAMNHPTSMHPRLARAIVNLTGIKKGTFVDPFCGSGGFLIEAGLMGLHYKGVDIDHVMLGRAHVNLNEHHLPSHLEVGDALKIAKSLEYVATDMPYSLNTRKSDIRSLFEGFMQVLSKRLKKRAVVVVPMYAQKKTPEYEKIAKANGLRVAQSFEQYVHHGLTRKILVLEP